MESLHKDDIDCAPAVVRFQASYLGFGEHRSTLGSYQGQRLEIVVCGEYVVWCFSSLQGDEVAEMHESLA